MGSARIGAERNGSGRIFATRERIEKNDPAGLEATAGYKAKVDTGTFSYACHAVAVAVDTEIGQVELLDYVIVEDGGTMIKMSADDIKRSGRATQGVIVMRLREGELVSSLAPVVESGDDEPGTSAPPSKRSRCARW